MFIISSMSLPECVRMSRTYGARKGDTTMATPDALSLFDCVYTMLCSFVLGGAVDLK